MSTQARCVAVISMFLLASGVVVRDEDALAVLLLAQAAPQQMINAMPRTAGRPQMAGGTKAVGTKESFVNFAKSADCPPGTIVSGVQGGVDIAIANEKGKYYAISNKLPPTGQPAVFADLPGDGTIQEPLTGSKFDLKTGDVVAWCTTPVGKLLGLLVQQIGVETYDVKESSGNLQAKIDVNAKAQFEQRYWRGVLDSQGKVDGGYY